MTGRAMQPLEKRLPRSKKSPEHCVVEFFDSYQGEWEPSDRCLELGVGEGRQLSAPAHYGFGLHGIDIDPLAVELSQQVIAERGIEAHIVLGEIADLPYPANYFRVVYAPSVFQMLPSIDEATKVMRETSRVLVPGGLFFLKVNGNPKREDANRRRRLEYLAFHELAQLAEASALEIERITTDLEDDLRRIAGKKLVWQIVFRKRP